MADFNVEEVHARVCCSGVERQPVRPEKLAQLGGVEVFMPMLSNKDIWVEVLGMSFEVEETKEVGQAQRRDKGRMLYLSDDGAEYHSKPEYIYREPNRYPNQVRRDMMIH